VRLAVIRFAADVRKGSDMTIAISRQNLDAAGLWVSASGSKDVAASRRMLAIALVLEGKDRADAARSAGMDRQTLRDWAHPMQADG
jgi:hypothetical protein